MIIPFQLCIIILSKLSNCTNHTPVLISKIKDKIKNDSFNKYFKNIIKVFQMTEKVKDGLNYKDQIFLFSKFEQ